MHAFFVAAVLLSLPHTRHKIHDTRNMTQEGGSPAPTKDQSTTGRDHVASTTNTTNMTQHDQRHYQHPNTNNDGDNNSSNADGKIRTPPQFSSHRNVPVRPRHPTNQPTKSPAANQPINQITCRQSTNSNHLPPINQLNHLPPIN